MSCSKKAHSDATRARIVGAFPSALALEVSAVLEVLSVARLEASAGDIGPVTVAGELLRIPQRVYFAPGPEDSLCHLSDEARLVLASLLTRHHDGHVRECWLRVVVESDRQWTAPFVVQLLGEYVIELAETMESLGVGTQPHLRAFIEENPAFARLTCARMVSYWNEYYRRQQPVFADYVCYRLARQLGLWTGRH